jgi:hypothetical protein
MIHLYPKHFHKHIKLLTLHFRKYWKKKINCWKFLNCFFLCLGYDNDEVLGAKMLHLKAN